MEEKRRRAENEERLKKGKRVESREERDERNEKGRERERDGSVFADPLSAASAPDPASPSPARLRLHQRLHPPLDGLG